MINLADQKYIAVVGASNNPEKYGNKIVKTLMDKGFAVWPINLKEEVIEGLKVFKSLNDLDRKPDMIVFVVPPVVTLQELDTVADNGFDDVWLQPGAFDDAVLKRINDLKLNVENERCVLVEATKL
jgi:predicted CoA-binding protein